MKLMPSFDEGSRFLGGTLSAFALEMPLQGNDLLVVLHLEFFVEVSIFHV